MANFVAPTSNHRRKYSEKISSGNTYHKLCGAKLSANSPGHGSVPSLDFGWWECPEKHYKRSSLWKADAKTFL